MDKYNNKETIKHSSFCSTFLDITSQGKKFFSYRSKRWILVVAIHLFFFLSFYIDLQLLEGSISGSRFLGFHMIDPFISLQMFASAYKLPINMIIGITTIVIIYLLMGGRSYCSWVCPYGLISEIGEKLHNSLVHKHIIKNRTFDHRVRHIFWFLFIGLAFSSGYLVFETFNVVGILSRLFIYGWSVAVIWVVVVFLMEVFFSRRAWCKYICPIGTTYSYIGKGSALKIQWNDNCDHCMVCHDVCFESHVLELTKAKYDDERTKKGIKTQYVTGTDCTLCGRCIDVCHADALGFEFRLKSLI